jgi:hypothetical protein
MTDEEARAVAYRAQRQQRAVQRRARVTALAGNPAAYAALGARWAPFRLARQEAQIANGQREPHAVE